MKLSFKSRDEWLAGRKEGLGASDWAEVLRPCLLEEDQELLYSSPYKLWAEKTGLAPEKDLSANESMEWGIRHEPTIAQALMDRTKREIILADEFSLYRSDDKPFLQASPDAFQRMPGRDGPGVLQIKSADFFMRKYWHDPETHERRPPTPFKIQVLAEMRVTGCSWGSLVVLIGGNRLFGPFDFDRNDGFYQTAEPHLEAFWDKVLTGTPPEIDGSDATGEVLKSMYPEAKGMKTVQLGEAALLEVERWQEQRKIRLAAEKIEKMSKVKLAGFMEDAAVGILPNGKKLLYPLRDRSGYTVAATTYRQFDLK